TSQSLVAVSLSYDWSRRVLGKHLVCLGSPTPYPRFGLFRPRAKKYSSVRQYSMRRGADFVPSPVYEPPREKLSLSFVLRGWRFVPVGEDRTRPQRRFNSCEPHPG